MFNNQNRPPGLISLILEAAVAIALSGWLIRLGIRFFLDALPTLAILAALIGGVIVGWKLWKYHRENRW